MDPSASLASALRALQRGDRRATREYLDNYWEWRANGGFQPRGGDAKARHIAKRMARKRKAGRMAGLDGFFTPWSANRRHYQKVYSSNVTSKVVPKKCALVRSGPKKGKLKRGCYFKNGHTYCDKVVAEKIKCDVSTPARKAARRKASVPKTLVSRKRKARKTTKRLGPPKSRKKSLQYREGRGYMLRGLRR